MNCLKCSAPIPSESCGLSMCIPCHMTELNKFMTSPRSIVEKNIESLQDCSIETIHSYWTALNEFNVRVKMFHDEQVRQEIKSGNRAKNDAEFVNVIKARNEKQAKKEAKEKKKMTEAQKADAKVIKNFLKIMPGKSAEQILNFMGDSFINDEFSPWTVARVEAAIPFAQELMKVN